MFSNSFIKELDFGFFKKKKKILPHSVFFFKILFKNHKTRGEVGGLQQFFLNFFNLNFFPIHCSHSVCLPLHFLNSAVRTTRVVSPCSWNNNLKTPPMGSSPLLLAVTPYTKTVSQ